MAIYFSKQKKTVHSLLCGFTCFYEVAFITFPIFYSVFTEFELEYEILVTPEDLALVLIGHLIFVLMFFLGFFLVKTRKSFANTEKREANVLSLHGRIFSTTLVIIGVITIITNLLSPLGSLDSIKEHAEIIRHTNVLSMMQYWFSGALEYPSLVAMSYVLSDKNYGSWIRKLAFVGTVSWLIYGLIIGLRGTLSRTLQLLLGFGLIKKNIKLVVIVSVMCLAGLSLFKFLQSEMRAQIYTDLSNESIIGKISFVGERLFDSVFLEGDKTPLGRTAPGFNSELIRSLAERAQDVRNSVSLYKVYDRGDGAGLKPLASALYFPIPRIVWSEKRPPGSASDDMYKTAMHIVQYEKGKVFFEMGPFLASAHAYWELGWLGIILIGLITGVFWRIVLDWCSARGSLLGIIVAITFAASLMTNGVVTMLHPLYSYFPAFWSHVIVLLVLSFIISIMIRLLRSSSLLRAVKIRRHDQSKK